MSYWVGGWVGGWVTYLSGCADGEEERRGGLVHPTVGGWEPHIAFSLYEPGWEEASVGERWVGGWVGGVGGGGGERGGSNELL